MQAAVDGSTGHAMDILERAVELDAMGELSQAEQLYRQGYIRAVEMLQFERDPAARRRMVKQGIEPFLERAEAIQKFLEEQGGCYVDVGRTGKRVAGEPAEKPWNAVVGLHQARSFLREQVILPCRFPGLLKDKQKRRPRDFKGVLFYGPPGTGKTFLLSSLAKLLAPLSPNCMVFHLSCSFLVTQAPCRDNGVSGEARLRQVFDNASRRRSEGLASVIIIDDIDYLAGTASKEPLALVGSKKYYFDQSVAEKVKEELLLGMHCVSNDHDGLFVLGTTSNPWGVDAALRRRFDRRIFCGGLDRDDRRQLIRRYVKDEDMFGSIERDAIDGTEGFTTSRVVSCLNQALMQPWLELQQARTFIKHEMFFLPKQDLADCVECESDSDWKKNLLDTPGDRIKLRAVTEHDFRSRIRDLPGPRLSHAESLRFRNAFD